MKSFIIFLGMVLLSPFATSTYAEVENNGTQPIDTTDHSSYWTEDPSPYYLRVTCGSETRTVNFPQNSDASSLGFIQKLDAPYGAPCHAEWKCFNPSNIGAPVMGSEDRVVRQGLLDSFDKAGCAPPFVSWSFIDGTNNAEQTTQGVWVQNVGAPVMRVNVVVAPELTYTPNPVAPGEKATVSWNLHGGDFSKDCSTFGCFKSSKVISYCSLSSEHPILKHPFGYMPWFPDYTNSIPDQTNKGTVETSILQNDESVSVDCIVAKKESGCWGLCNTGWSILYQGKATVVINVEDDATAAQLNITANPLRVDEGEKSRVSWTTQNVKAGSCSCIGTNGQGVGAATSSLWRGENTPAGGLETLPLTENTTYTLNCLDLEDRPVSDSVTIVADDDALDLSVSCEANTSTADIGEEVIWTATAVGGTGSYTYNWSGDLPDGARTAATRYWTEGTYTASVTVRSGDETKNVSCDGSVEVGDGILTGDPEISFTARPPRVNKGQTTHLYLETKNISGCLIKSSVDGSYNEFVALASGSADRETHDIDNETTFTAQCWATDGSEVPLKKLVVPIVGQFSEE